MKRRRETAAPAKRLEPQMNADERRWRNRQGEAPPSRPNRQSAIGNRQSEDSHAEVAKGAEVADKAAGRVNHGDTESTEDQSAIGNRQSRESHTEAAEGAQGGETTDDG